MDNFLEFYLYLSNLPPLLNPTASIRSTLFYKNLTLPLVLLGIQRTSEFPIDFSLCVLSLNQLSLIYLLFKFHEKYHSFPCDLCFIFFHIFLLSFFGNWKGIKENNVLKSLSLTKILYFKLLKKTQEIISAKHFRR